jgi:hypothetical protein
MDVALFAAGLELVQWELMEIEPDGSPGLVKRRRGTMDVCGGGNDDRNDHQTVLVTHAVALHAFGTVEWSEAG